MYRVRFVSVNGETSRVKPAKKNFEKNVRKKILGKKFWKKNFGEKKFEKNFSKKVLTTKIKKKKKFRNKNIRHETL